MFYYDLRNSCAFLHYLEGGLDKSFFDIPLIAGRNVYKRSLNLAIGKIKNSKLPFFVLFSVENPLNGLALVIGDQLVAFDGIKTGI